MRKNQAGGLSSTDFGYHWNDAQATYMDDLLGRFQARNNGKEGSNTGLILDETILQKLSPFVSPATLTVTSGDSDKPLDLMYRLAMRIGGYDVNKINHGQIASVNNSVIDPPSVAANKYYFVEYEDYYSFLPNTVTSADLDYVKSPQNVLWAYILDSDGRQLYDAANSIQPQWDNNSCMEITKRMLTNLGVSFKDQDFLNFGKSVQVTGE